MDPCTLLGKYPATAHLILSRVLETGHTRSNGLYQWEFTIAILSQHRTSRWVPLVSLQVFVHTYQVVNGTCDCDLLLRGKEGDMGLSEFVVGVEAVNG